MAGGDVDAAQPLLTEDMARYDRAGVVEQEDRDLAFQHEERLALRRLRVAVGCAVGPAHQGVQEAVRVREIARVKVVVGAPARRGPSAREGAIDEVDPGAECQKRRSPRLDLRRPALRSLGSGCYGGPSPLPWSVSGGEEDADDVEEHQGHRGEQLEGGADVAVFGEVVDDVGRVVQDRGAGEGDHGHREEHAELEAEQDASGDQHQGRDAAPHQEPAQEREVLARDESDRGQAREADHRGDARAGDDARRVVLGVGQERARR